ASSGGKRSVDGLLIPFWLVRPAPFSRSHFNLNRYSVPEFTAYGRLWLGTENSSTFGLRRTSLSYPFIQHPLCQNTSEKEFQAASRCRDAFSAGKMRQYARASSGLTSSR